MIIRSLPVVGAVAVVVCAVGVSTTLIAQDSGQKVRMVAAPPTASNPVVMANSTVSFTSEVSAEVDVWVSEPLLSLDGSRPVRVIAVKADYNCNRLSINQAHVFGTFDAQSSEALHADTDSVSIGIAKQMAKRILGVDGEAEFVPERVGPFGVVVRPVEGKTWGSVLAESDIEIAATEGK